MRLNVPFSAFLISGTISPSKRRKTTVAPLVFLIPYAVRNTKNEIRTVLPYFVFLCARGIKKRFKMSFFVFLIPCWMWHTKHSIHENSFFARRVSISVLTIYVENAIYSSFFVFRVRQKCDKRYGKPCVDFRTAYGKRKTSVFRFFGFRTTWEKRINGTYTDHVGLHSVHSDRCYC